MIEKIGVFLSANEDVPDSFRQATEDVAAWIGRTGRTLVFGGASKGMMEVLAQGVKRSGGRTFGIVPQILVDRGAVSDALDVTFRTADLNDRKAQLIELSDVLLALPGGIGTLDEVFTALGARSIGIGAPRVILYNVDGCWDKLLSLLDSLYRQKLLRDKPERIVSVVSSVAELEALLAKD